MKRGAIIVGCGIWVVAGQGATQAPSSPPRAPLWQGLVQGMNYDEAASAIRAIPGVTTVKITTHRKQPSGLQISYAGSGVEVGPLTATLEPKFVADRLESVVLTGDNCRAAGDVKAVKLNEGLAEKYGRGTLMRVVDDAGVTIDRRMSYSSDLTHVTVSAAPHNEARDALAAVGHNGGGGVGRLSDSLALVAAKQALAACPDDHGERLRTIVTYEPQASFLAERKAYRDREDADRQKAARSL